MTGQLTAAHLSGDLGQAIATTGDTTWLIDAVSQRRPLLNEVQLFFNSAVEIVTIDDQSLADLTLDKLQTRLLAEAKGYELLELLLAGMDPELSTRTRLNLIARAAGLAEDAESFNFAKRRILRATDTDIWHPQSAAKLAENSGTRKLVEVYQVIAGPVLGRVESRVISWRPGLDVAPTVSALLEMARDSGLIAEVAIALHRRDWSGLRLATAKFRYSSISELARHLENTAIPLQPPPVPTPPEDYDFTSDDELELESPTPTSRFGRVDYGMSVDMRPLFREKPGELTRLSLVYGRLDQLLDRSGFERKEIIEASFRMADHPCFFVDDTFASWDLHRDELIRSIFDRRFEIFPLPSRKQIRRFTRRRAISLIALLKIDFALHQISRFDRSTSLPLGLNAGSIVPSVFVARPEELRWLREEAQIRSVELSRLIFGGAGNIWGRLESGAERGRIGITWATVEKIATVLGKDALYVFKPAHEFTSKYALRPLEPKSGNIILATHASHGLR